VAINHYNTDELHAHILLRGKREDGRDLVLPRPYIRHQMRQTAQELATRRLGPRTLEQANEATRKQVHAQRYTSLDHWIERQMDAHQRVQLKEMGAAP
jgi:type IV secretory pathway VirD2 relaxase